MMVLLQLNFLFDILRVFDICGRSILGHSPPPLIQISMDNKICGWPSQDLLDRIRRACQLHLGDILRHRRSCPGDP